MSKQRRKPSPIKPTQFYNGTPCIDWPGTLSRGYGKVVVDGKAIGAHRAVYEAHKGKIPDGLVIDHLCCNRSCVNPDHLEPVTQRVNVLRGMQFRSDKPKDRVFSSDKRAVRMREWYRKNIQRGHCAFCKNPLDPLSTFKCSRHLESANSYRREKRREAREAKKPLPPTNNERG